MRFIELGQCDEAVFDVGFGLRSEVAEKLRAVIYEVVAVAVEGEPGVIRAEVGPGEMFERAVGVDVEIDAGGSIREVEAIALSVYQDRAGALFRETVSAIGNTYNYFNTTY